MKVVGLFAGIGGIEEGLSEAGIFEPVMFCEWWEPAKTVLRTRFPGVPIFGDITSLERLPRADLVCGGFPCTDISLAGRMAGLDGAQSGLVLKALDLIGVRRPQWLLLENVRNLLPLHGGRAMRSITDRLSAMGYRWAYRLVDSRFTGVPQRRQRVIILASRVDDPREVLFADDAGELPESHWRPDAFGFYWTEGRRSLGWCIDGIPTLKGGSNIGIPSPPAIWIPSATDGARIVTPTLAAAEKFQGFASDWTLPGGFGSKGDGARWKMLGNAVTVGVSKWVGSRLQRPGTWRPELSEPLAEGSAWPAAAWGESGRAWRVSVSMWPTHQKYQHLLPFLGDHTKPLSARATNGFLGRLLASDLASPHGFVPDLQRHLAHARSTA